MLFALSSTSQEADMTDPELMAKLHQLLTQNLIDKIESGEATAADLGVARQLLKDNGVNATPSQGTPILRLSQALPFDEAQEAV
jgi:hypothetical protein